MKNFSILICILFVFSTCKKDPWIYDEPEPSMDKQYADIYYSCENLLGAKFPDFSNFRVNVGFEIPQRNGYTILLDPGTIHIGNIRMVKKVFSGWPYDRYYYGYDHELLKTEHAENWNKEIVVGVDGNDENGYRKAQTTITMPPIISVIAPNVTDSFWFYLLFKKNRTNYIQWEKGSINDSLDISIYYDGYQSHLNDTTLPLEDFDFTFSVPDNGLFAFTPEIFSKFPLHSRLFINVSRKRKKRFVSNGKTILFIGESKSGLDVILN